MEPHNEATISSMLPPSLILSGVTSDGAARLVDRTVSNAADFSAFMVEARPQAFVAEVKNSAAQAAAARIDLVRLLVLSTVSKHQVQSFVAAPESSFSALYKKVLQSVAKPDQHWVWVARALLRNSESLSREVDRLLASITTVSPSTDGAEHENAGVMLRDELLAKEDWLDSKEVHQLLGMKGNPSNAGQTAARLRGERKIFGVKHAGKCLHPSVQFDRRSGTVLPVVAPLLAVLPEESNGWRNLFWLFESRKSLGDRRPADLLATHPKDVLKAAKDAFEANDAHW